MHVRNVIVEERSWTVDEDGETGAMSSEGGQWDSDDPVTAALVSYGYARI